MPVCNEDFNDKSDCNEDSDDMSNDTKSYIVRCNTTALHNRIISSHPSSSDLKRAAKQILENILEVNNHCADYKENHDCVAVGYSPDGGIYIAANVKERFPWRTAAKKDHINYGELGLNEKLVAVIKDVLESKLNTYGQYEVTVIKQKLHKNEPSTVYTNARDHAEMQLLAHARQDGFEITTMGISKPACRNCKTNLDHEGVLFHQDGEGNQNPRNWGDPKDIETEELAFIPKRSIIVYDRHEYDFNHNIPKRRNEAFYQITQHVKQQVIPKPSCHVTTSSFLDIIEDIDSDPSAHAGTFNAYAGTYKKKRTGRIGAYAGASVAEASARAGIFGASASMLSASAHAEVGPNFSAGANASLARAEAHAGPIQFGVGLNANTSVSAGVDGIHASVLGFGFDFGPKMSIQTPVFDASCNVM